MVSLRNRQRRRPGAAHRPLWSQGLEHFSKSGEKMSVFLAEGYISQVACHNLCSACMHPPPLRSGSPFLFPGSRARQQVNCFIISGEEGFHWGCQLKRPQPRGHMAPGSGISGSSQSCPGPAPSRELSAVVGGAGGVSGPQRRCPSFQEEFLQGTCSQRQVTTAFWREDTWGLWFLNSRCWDPQQI